VPESVPNDVRPASEYPIWVTLAAEPYPLFWRRFLLEPLLAQDAHSSAVQQGAGVPREDARGRITSHRARTTIATQLYNAKEPMTLLDLQAWLGHRSHSRRSSTPRSCRRTWPGHTPTPATSRAMYGRSKFWSTVRASRTALPQVEHRGSVSILAMASARTPSSSSARTASPGARCEFYVPKKTPPEAQFLEARGNLQRMLAQIPLTDDQRAVEDGTAAVERLLDRLLDTPTPAGPTPRQLSAGPSFIPLSQVTDSNTA
jgi:hypothetical protein